MSKRANGEGSIWKRSDGRWEARVSLESGQRKAFYGKTRQDVARKLAAALKASQDGLPTVGERQTVRQYLKGWLESVQPSLRPKTTAEGPSRARDFAAARPLPLLPPVSSADLFSKRSIVFRRLADCC